MRKTDLLYFRRSYAQSKVELETRTASDGRRFTTSSLNSERLSDATRHYLQNNIDYSEFKYDRLEALAEKELLPAFERLGLNRKNLSKKEQKEVNRKKRIAISNWQERYIRDNFPNILHVDFDEFISNTNIKKAQNGIKNALEVLIDAQNSNFYRIEHHNLDLETGEVSFGISRVNALPSITLWLDDSLSDKGYSLESFAADKNLKNKRKYIKGLQIEFSPMYLYHVLSIGNDYVTSFKSKRDCFTHSFSHKLDILLNSLYRIKNNVSALTFEVDELKKLLGVPQDVEYKYFKRNVLNKALVDLQRYSDKNIDMIENREWKKVISVTFVLNKKEVEAFLAFFYDYIASQLYYFSKKVAIDSIEKFSKFLLNSKFDEDEIIGGSKSLSEWRIEAEQAFVSENNILEWIENDELFFIKNKIIYDKKKHTILREKTETIDGEEIVKYEIIKVGDKKITNPTASYKYLMSKEAEEIKNSIHVADMLPFAYADNKTQLWIHIDTIEDLISNKEAIYKDIAMKNFDRFAFDREERSRIFKYYAEKNLFGDINSSVKKRIASLFD